jgi:transposase
LQKFIFSGKQEKFKSNTEATPVQADLFPNDKLAEVVKEKEVTVPEHKKVTTSVRIHHKGRNPLPAHLRREVVVLEPTADTTGLTAIGEEITETLEYQHAEIYVKQIKRPEYIKPSADNSNAKRIIATLPDNGFSKCIAGITLLTYIAISKYIDHLPIYRLIKMLSRDKVKIDDATIYGWLKRICILLEPLYQLHRQTVLSTKYLSADETTIAVLDEQKKGATHQGYFWAYYDTDQHLVLFEYQKGRAAVYPKEVLKNYKGYLLSDGYEGYGQFDDVAGIITHNCWAHARRKFYDAQNFDKYKSEAVLTLIAKLYAVEREHKGNAADVRFAARQKEAVPVLNELFALLTQYQQDCIPGTPLHTAVRYSLERWEKLCVYTTNGNLQIDNNLLENSIRPIALGRKNYLFAGSHEAAQRSAMFYSFFYTCHEHGVNPREWLEHTLKHIYETKTSQLHQLLPQNYNALINKK